MKVKFESKLNKAHHYFASSIAEWKVNTDIQKLIKDMEKSGFMFTVWYVPADITDDYEINCFNPIVKGAIHLETFSPCE